MKKLYKKLIKIIMFCFIGFVAYILFILFVAIPYFGYDGKIVDETIPSLRFKKVGFFECDLMGIDFYYGSDEHLESEDIITDETYRKNDVVINVSDYSKAYNTLIREGEIIIRVNYIRTPYTGSTKFILLHDKGGFELTRRSSHYNPWWLY